MYQTSTRGRKKDGINKDQTLKSTLDSVAVLLLISKRKKMMGGELIEFMENQGLIKCGKRKKLMGGDADLISGLPDEILLSILSRLTMKEAGRTSVLSRRWQYLWEFRTGSMDFDFGKNVTRRIKARSEWTILEAERARYTSRVNSIISRRRDSSIEEFKVDFDIRDHPQIDSWVDFALKKRVQSLDLRLTPVRVPRESYDLDGLYRLPVGAAGSDITFLKSLTLQYVTLTGEDFEYILSNCKLLEYLAIAISIKLVKSTVVTPCLNLKYLELEYCLDLEELEIYSAPNLTTFYCTREARFRFRNVPKLSHVSIGGSYYEDIVDRFHDLPISLSQLQKLTLKVDAAKTPGFWSFPELKNVKELELIVVITIDKSLLSYTRLMKACPNLSRVMMEFQWWTRRAEEEVVALPSHTEGGIYGNLKDLELVWFRGEAIDVELVNYILCNSPNIEKIKVGTRRPPSVQTRVDEEDGIFQKEFVAYLAKPLSPSTQLLLV